MKSLSMEKICRESFDRLKSSLDALEDPEREQAYRFVAELNHLLRSHLFFGPLPVVASVASTAAQEMPCPRCGFKRRAASRGRESPGAEEETDAKQGSFASLEVPVSSRV